MKIKVLYSTVLYKRVYGSEIEWHGVKGKPQSDEYSTEGEIVFEGDKCEWEGRS